MQKREVKEMIDYNEAEIQAQGCWDDCTVVIYSNKNTSPSVVNGSAITANNCKEKKNKSQTPKKSFFR